MQGLTTNEAATATMDRLLRHADQGDNLALAGGLAAEAMRRGWDDVLGAWVGSPALGGVRGGWGTVAKIKEAQRLAKGHLPDVLADLPPLEDMVADLSAPQPRA